MFSIVTVFILLLTQKNLRSYTKYSVFVSGSEVKWPITLAAGVCFYSGCLHHINALPLKTGIGVEEMKAQRWRGSALPRTPACTHARTQAHKQELENNELHDCTNRTKTLKCPRHRFHLLFYHFITTIIIFLSHDYPPPHTCTHTNTLTLSAESCICIYLLSFSHWVFSSLCCLRQWWQIPALVRLTTETAAERVKLHPDFLISSHVSLGKQVPSRN